MRVNVPPGRTHMQRPRQNPDNTYACACAADLTDLRGGLITGVEHINLEVVNFKKRH